MRRKTLPVIIGALMILVGAIWTLQGLGYIGGSGMSGKSVWAIVGPIVAGFGAGLIYVASRGTAGRR